MKRDSVGVVAEGLVSIADQNGFLVAGEIHRNTSGYFIAPIVKVA
jgi:hypothetical protein